MTSEFSPETTIGELLNFQPESLSGPWDDEDLRKIRQRTWYQLSRAISIYKIGRYEQSDREEVENLSQIALRVGSICDQNCGWPENIDPNEDKIKLIREIMEIAISAGNLLAVSQTDFELAEPGVDREGMKFEIAGIYGQLAKWSRKYGLSFEWPDKDKLSYADLKVANNTAMFDWERTLELPKEEAIPVLDKGIRTMRGVVEQVKLDLEEFPENYNLALSLVNFYNNLGILETRRAYLEAGESSQILIRTAQEDSQQGLNQLLKIESKFDSLKIAAYRVRVLSNLAYAFTIEADKMDIVDANQLLGPLRGFGQNMQAAEDVLAHLPEGEAEEAVKQDFAAEIPRRTAQVLRLLYQVREKFGEGLSAEYQDLERALIKEFAGEGDLKKLAYQKLFQAQEATQQNDDVIFLREERQAFAQTFGNMSFL